MKRWILHADMDAFFPSVEQVLEPKLKNKPVIVGSFPHERGVVSSASYEARAFGVKAGMSARLAGKLCPQGIFIHGNHEAYKKYSDIIKSIFLRFTDQVEMFSLDEAFLDLSDCQLIYASIPTAARALQTAVWQETGLTCSVGIAANRTVAKVASDYEKPRGFTHVPCGQEAKFLAPLDIRDLPGIGPQSAKQLRMLGINRLGDIQRCDQKFFAERWGKCGLSLWKRARGIDNSSVQVTSQPKSVSRETTFAADTCNYKILITTLAGLVEKAAFDLRRHGLRARSLQLKIRYRDFTTSTFSCQLLLATDVTCDLLAAMNNLFANKYRRGDYLRLLGVGFSGLVLENSQTNLFDILEAAKNMRRSKIGEAVDKIRRRFGFSKMRILSSFSDSADSNYRD
jgi:DNA polymerase IV